MSWKDLDKERWIYIFDAMICKNSIFLQKKWPWYVLDFNQIKKDFVIYFNAYYFFISWSWKENSSWTKKKDGTNWEQWLEFTLRIWVLERQFSNILKAHTRYKFHPWVWFYLGLLTFLLREASYSVLMQIFLSIKSQKMIIWMNKVSIVGSSLSFLLGFSTLTSGLPLLLDRTENPDLIWFFNLCFKFSNPRRNLDSNAVWVWIFLRLNFQLLQLECCFEK